MAKAKAQVVRWSPPSQSFGRQAPIVVNIPKPRAIAVSKPKVKHRRRRSGGGIGAKADLFGPVIGGYGLAMIEKYAGDKLPTVPLIGRKGTIGLMAYFWNKHHPSTIARDIAIVALGLAGYQMGKDGHIDGDE